MRVASLLCLLALCVAPAAVAEEPVKVPPGEKAVRNLEREWLDAYEKHDAEAMDRIVAEDFAITFPNGDIQEKPALMSMIRAPRTGPEMRFHTEGVRSRSYGDTVILMGVVVAEYEKEGKPVSEKSRYTDTYVRRNGKWQVVASHLSGAGQ